MLSRRGYRRHELHPNADINLVNLVDLAFVLLIIFMITAPMLQGGIDVQLPRTSATPMTADQGVIVSLDRSGTIYIGEVPMRSQQDFVRQLPSSLGAAGKRVIFLKGDQQVPYGKVLEVFSLLKEMDVADVNLMVEPDVKTR
jgi:biopolymer transport protein TolR